MENYKFSTLASLYPSHGYNSCSFRFYPRYKTSVCVCVRARARACVYSTNHCFYPYHLRPPAKSQEARADDVSVNELASYLETLLNLPQPMSYMASLMYN